MNNKSANLIHKTFEIGVFLKGLDGVLEIIGGVLLFIVKPETINHILILLTQGELSEDPKDLIAGFLVKSAHSLSVSSQFFGGLFLLSHGIIKVFLVIALLKKKLWAYPAAMIIFGLFIVYQLYRHYFSHSTWMVFLSVLDIFVIVLTYMEYRDLKHHLI